MTQGTTAEQANAPESMRPEYDVVILGAGFEGGLLGTILAHQGAKVLIIDSGSHPRFALGESTVRHTFKLLKIIGERYRIREIQEKFSRAELVHKYVTSSCGEKSNFGFIYHREGQDQQPHEANQLVVAKLREGYEAHLFRQDIDGWLTFTAVHYGATVKYKTQITDVVVRPDGVTLRSAAGETFTARFIADASGSHSVLARVFQLHAEPRFVLNTRCLFTHMIDVQPYDDLRLPHGVPRARRPWYNGTCHHVFDGGWLWVIPFNNREGSTNPLVSIGLQYDNERLPRPIDKAPEEEWQGFLDRFPSIREQFRQAKLARDWISSDRLQTDVTSCIGYRYVLTAAANGSGFVDALYSRGLSNSTEFINALVPRLLKALSADDFSVQRFEYLETLRANTMLRNDQMVRSSYTAFRDYDMWNAWFRIWAIAVGLGDLRLANALRRYRATGDESVLPDAEEPRGLFMNNSLEFAKLFDAAVDEADAVREGRLHPKQAAQRIFQLIRESPIASPGAGFGDPNHKIVDLMDPKTLAGTLRWVATDAPPEIKEWVRGSLADIGPLKPFLNGKTAPSLKLST